MTDERQAGLREALLACVLAVRDGLVWCARHDSAWPIARPVCDVVVIARREAGQEPPADGLEVLRAVIEYTAIPTLLVFAENNAGVREAIATLRAALAAQTPAQEERLDVERLLDGIRDEVREAVEEGDRQDCSSSDCIADAVYDIVRVRLRALGVESKEEGAGQRPPRLSGEPEEPHGLLSAGRNLSHSVGRRGVPRQGPRTRDTPS